MLTDTGSAKTALDRIVIPQGALDRIAGIAPRSSLIITDEALSSETGNGTDFVVLLSGEPQGGIKIRRRGPAAEFPYARPRDRLPHWGLPRGSLFDLVSLLFPAACCFLLSEALSSPLPAQRHKHRRDRADDHVCVGRNTHNQPPTTTEREIAVASHQTAERFLVTRSFEVPRLSRRARLRAAVGFALSKSASGPIRITRLRAAGAARNVVRRYSRREPARELGMLQMGYPHWLIVAGAVLLALGFVGLAFHRNRDVEPNDEPTEAGCWSLPTGAPSRRSISAENRASSILPSPMR
jgi:hypothetical protein